MNVDRYNDGYIYGLKHKVTTPIARETVLATLGLLPTDSVDTALLANSALFAVGYNDAVKENLKLNNK